MLDVPLLGHPSARRLLYWVIRCRVVMLDFPLAGAPLGSAPPVLSGPVLAPPMLAPLR
jgi:hypothetical protein